MGGGGGGEGGLVLATLPFPMIVYMLDVISYVHIQAVNSVVAALRDADLNLNPIPEKSIIKVPLPK